MSIVSHKSVMSLEKILWIKELVEKLVDKKGGGIWTNGLRAVHEWRFHIAWKSQFR